MGPVPDADNGAKCAHGSSARIPVICLVPPTGAATGWSEIEFAFLAEVLAQVPAPHQGREGSGSPDPTPTQAARDSARTSPVLHRSLLALGERRRWTPLPYPRLPCHRHQQQFGCGCQPSQGKERDRSLRTQGPIKFYALKVLSRLFGLGSRGPREEKKGGPEKGRQLNSSLRQENPAVRVNASRTPFRAICCTSSCNPICHVLGQTRNIPARWHCSTLRW